ncbi:hypothetical protein POM88_044061 [Heracleum sosnowskyi]|uniref:FIST domain-containing protein n=1 Tax=Heracleum sosnowskyi TaxID=360622 RepID=A0AAD8H242_9APIA|nr:hypothetical protein POM88_044061 [Heracleum sosnowskyi]
MQIILIIYRIQIIQDLTLKKEKVIVGDALSHGSSRRGVQQGFCRAHSASFHNSAAAYASLDLDEARELISKKLGSSIPIVYTAPIGLIGRDAITNEFKEIQWETKTEQFEDKFLKDISECTTSVSGYTAHVGIILFTDGNIDSDHLLQNMDHSMSPETVIVGDRCGEFLCGDDFMDKISKMKCQTLTIGAIALLFMRDRNKPYGIGDIKLHVALSVGLSPVGHMYEVTSVNESSDSMTELTAKREDSDENLDDEAITDTIDEIKWISTQVFREIQGLQHYALFHQVVPLCASRLKTKTVLLFEGSSPHLFDSNL